MKIILIIYIIGIVLYWLGIASIISTMKKNKERALEAFNNRSNKRSMFSNWLAVITGSIIPVFHYIIAFLYIFKPDFIFDEE